MLLGAAATTGSDACITAQATELRHGQFRGVGGVTQAGVVVEERPHDWGAHRRSEHGICTGTGTGTGIATGFERTRTSISDRVTGR